MRKAFLKKARDALLAQKQQIHRQLDEEFREGSFDADGLTLRPHAAALRPGRIPQPGVKGMMDGPRGAARPGVLILPNC